MNVQKMNFRKNQYMRRGTAMVLAGCMVFGLTACSGGEDKETSADGGRHYFKTTFAENLPDSFNGNLSGGAIIKNDVLYYGTYNNDWTNYGLYSYNILTGEEKELWSYQQGDDENKYVNYFSVDDEGNVYLYVSASVIDESSLSEDYSNATEDDVINYMVNDWGYSDEEDARNDWNEYYVENYTGEDGTVDYGKFLVNMHASYIYTSAIEAYDASGSQIYTLDLTEMIGENSYCNSMVVDQNGNLVLGMESYDEMNSSYFAAVLDKTGSQKGKIMLDEYVYNMFVFPDGRVGANCWLENGEGIVVLDIDKMEVGETINIGTSVSGIKDDDELFVTDGTNLYVYNMNDASKEKYLTWVDCNISSSSVSTFGQLSDGRMAVVTSSWNSISSKNVLEIAFLQEVDKSEIGDVKEINVACLWLDSDLEQRVIDYNKKNSDYHINVKSYYDDSMDWDDMVKSFTTALTSDKDIDIIMFNDYAQVLNYASKGLMTDLYPLLESDEELSKEDFMQGVINNCEYDGKLVMLPTSFSVQTVVGKTSDVGDTPGWTLDDVKALLASKEEGTQLFYAMTRQEILNFCLSLGYDEYIDMENSTCSFDNEDFVDVLEFAAMFPEEFEWEEGVDETVLMNTGKVLLSAYYFSDLEQIQMYTEIFGGPLTYIGYPTKEGNGAMLYLSGMMGITESCEEKEAAWDFLRQFYMDKSEEELEYTWNFPVRKDDFDEYCENFMDEDRYGGYSWGWGSFDIEIKPATQADVDACKELIENTTAVSGAVSDDVLAIIEEEAAGFFAGQKTAEEVAEIIQSRMQIYLSETK